MTDYEFVLKFSLPEAYRDLDDLIEKLGEAGCTDATVGIGITGIVALDFAREAGSAEDAFCSAIADVRRAIPEAILLEASPDLVGLSDVAEHVGVARQSIRKLMTTHEDFPSPTYSGTTSLWHLADVLTWLKGRKGYDPAETVIETAEMTRVVNIAKDRRRYTVTQKIDSLTF